MLNRLFRKTEYSQYKHFVKNPFHSDIENAEITS
jgi:hypothetical protein